MPSQTQTETIIVGVFVALAVLIAAPIGIWRATWPQQARTAIVLEGGLSVFPRPTFTDDNRSRYMRYMRRATRASWPSSARQTC
jgi:O-antigen ligase